MIHFIHGPDRFLARQAMQRIVARFDPEGTNTSWLDGRESSFESVIAAVGTASFFGGPRVVVVTDLIARAAPEKRADTAQRVDSGRSGKDASVLSALLSAVPDDHHLILLEPTMTGSPAPFKSSAKVEVISSEPPRGAALIAWIEEAARQRGARIDRRPAQCLVEALFPQTWNRKPRNPRYDRPPDMALLSNELEKLALAAHPGPITVQLVQDLVGNGPDERIFRFIDAAMSGEVAGSMQELDRLQAAGAEPAMVMAQTLGQVELATVVAAAGARDADSIARDLGSVTASRLAAVMGAARRRAGTTRRALEVAVKVDRNLKTGRLKRPEDALYNLALGLADAASRQERDRSM